MEEVIRTLPIGGSVPSIGFDVYLSSQKDFGRMNLTDCAKDGKWLILFFYPADYSFVCTTELADLGEKYAEFRNERAEIVSMSTDNHFVKTA